MFLINGKADNLMILNELEFHKLKKEREKIIENAKGAEDTEDLEDYLADIENLFKEYETHIDQFLGIASLNKTEGL